MGLMLQSYIVTKLHVAVLVIFCKEMPNCEGKNLVVWKKMLTFARH